MKAVLAILILVAFSTSCGKDPDTKKDSPRGNDPQAIFNLNGLNGSVYQSACMIQSDAPAPRSSVEMVTFAQDSFERTWINFDGEACDTAGKRSSFHYTLGNVGKQALPDLEGWETYQYEYAALSVQVHQQPIADSFNTYKVYGHEGWKVGEGKDIAGRKYSETDDKAEHTVGTKRIATVKLEDGKISFANYSSGSAAAEGAFVYKKVSP